MPAPSTRPGAGSPDSRWAHVSQPKLPWGLADLMGFCVLLEFCWVESTVSDWPWSGLNLVFWGGGTLGAVEGLGLGLWSCQDGLDDARANSALQPRKKHLGLVKICSPAPARFWFGALTRCRFCKPLTEMRVVCCPAFEMRGVSAVQLVPSSSCLTATNRGMPPCSCCPSFPKL